VGELVTMPQDELVTVGRVSALWRYPVKSMLGEQVGGVDVGDRGLEGDRRLGVVDRQSGMVASAKRPRRWQDLLQIRSEMTGSGVVRLVFPDGRSVLSTDDLVDKLLSEFLGREVDLVPQAAPGATLERAVPAAVLDQGVDADVDVTYLEIAEASPSGAFFDFSPLHLVTSASLERAGVAHPAGRVESARYRPNIVVETSPGLSGFVENDWPGHRLHLGSEVILEILIVTPRCAVPTLRHGGLPPDPDALRVALAHNFLSVPLEGFGSAACLGVYAGVVEGGRVSPGDEVRLTI
jgi:uncharacterized protein YcbX